VILFLIIAVSSSNWLTYTSQFQTNINGVSRTQSLSASFSLRGFTGLTPDKITGLTPETTQPIYVSFETVDSTNLELNCTSAGRSTLALESVAIILEFGALFILIFAFYKKQSIDSVNYKRNWIMLIGISMFFMIVGVVSFRKSDCITLQRRVPFNVTLTLTSGVGEVLTGIAIVLQVLLAIGILYGKSFSAFILESCGECFAC
jgi:hypothetical protein